MPRPSPFDLRQFSACWNPNFLVIFQGELNLDAPALPCRRFHKPCFVAGASCGHCGETLRSETSLRNLVVKKGGQRRGMRLCFQTPSDISDSFCMIPAMFIRGFDQHHGPRILGLAIMSFWLVAFRGLYNLCCEEKSEYAAYAADVMAAAAKLRASLEGAGFFLSNLVTYII